MTVLMGLFILLVLAGVDHWLFATFFNTNHLQWYMNQGPLIGLVTAIVPMVWGDINKHTGLISAHPWDYFGSCLQLVGLPIYVLGTHLKSRKDRSERRFSFDLFITVFFVPILSMVILIWVIVVVPLQYFVYLICGAPGRAFFQSDRRPIAQLRTRKLEVAEISKSEKIPDGWWDAGISDKPVSITNLFQSLFFLILQQI